MSCGNRIYTKRTLAEPELIESFRELPAANVADCMGRSCAMNPRIHLISSPKRPLVGSALTVKCRAGDNLMIHAAMEMAGEGDVLVVSNEGDDKRALIGEVMMTYLRYEKKIAGIVLDGPIRDIEELSQWDFPIYATGSTPGGPYKEGPGEINVPIACGEISVYPGDIILADHDGVIAIPIKDAPTVLEAARVYHEKDEAKAAATKAGKADRGWVKKLLEKKEVEVIDDLCVSG